MPSLTSLSASTCQMPRLSISAMKDAAEGSTMTLASFCGPMNSIRSSTYCQIFQLDRGDAINAQQFRCLKASMPGQDHTVGINENRVGKTEAFDTVGNLPNLPFRVRPRVVRTGFKCSRRLVLDRQGFRGGGIQRPSFRWESLLPHTCTLHRLRKERNGPMGTMGTWTN